MAELIDILRNFAPWSEAEAGALQGHFKAVTVKKGQTLLHKGDLCDRIFFIRNGGLRTWFYDNKGREVTRYIGLPGNFCTTLDSFIEGSACKENVEAFATSEILLLHRDTHLELRGVNAKWERAYVQLMEFGYVLTTWRLISTLSLSAEERFEDLRARAPHLLREVPDRIIASYLGMAPEYLSRLKAKALRVKS